MAAAPSNRRDHRWAVYSTKKVIIITENLDWPGPAGGSPPSKTEFHFLAISQGSGESREGVENLEGLQQKLVSLCGAGARPPPPQTCCAVLGCIVVEETGFLVVVLEADVAAIADGKRVLEIRRCELLPFATLPPKGKAPPSDSAAEANASKAASVKQLLEKGFYFSHDFDITRRLQRRLFGAEAPAVRLTDGTIDQMASAEARFVWNRQMVEPFTVQGVSSRWFTPVMQGFIQARECKVAAGGVSCVLLLIARRGSRRAGTRYNARGIDDAGEVANWVETEQLVQIQDPTQTRSASTASTKGGWLSFVQVRGSVPLFWDQPSSMSPVTITRGPDLVAVAFEKHKRWMEQEYGKLLYVNLLSDSAAKRETEGVLTTAMAQQVKMDSGAQLLHLDFHARVNTDEAQFDRDLACLTERLTGQVLERIGYFDSTRDPPCVLQKGVVRTNCFDCLDRTNILQYQLVWSWLSQYCSKRPELQLMTRPTPVNASSPASMDLGSFGDLFRNAVGDLESKGTMRAPLQRVLSEMWADLGDMLSEHYTGVASTMGAALRQGGNAASILLEKGFRSVNRAFSAKFGDEARQRVLDLLLGRHRLPRAPGAPEVRRQPAGRLMVGVATWNLHGEPYWQAPGSLQMLLRGTCCPGAGKPTDVVVFCFQEFVELSPANVVMHDAGDAARQNEFETMALQTIFETLGEPFLMARSCGMVGLYIGIFVAERLRASVKNVAADRVRSGLFGQTGNKGAVAVRLEIAETSVCVVSVHLESGQSKAKERAEQLSEVVQHSFSGAAFKAPKPVKDHDLLVLAGDFNFRLAVPEGSNTEQLESMLQQGWPATSDSNTDPGAVGDGISTGSAPAYQEAFNQFDELMGSRGHSTSRDHVRDAGLMEGPVLFPATYKFIKGAQVYDKQRRPAWCDRILHTKFDVVRRHYVSLGGLLQSDHRPVAALLDTSLLAMPNATTTSLPAIGVMSPDVSSSLGSNAKPVASGSGAADLLGDLGTVKATAAPLSQGTENLIGDPVSVTSQPLPAPVTSPSPPAPVATKAASSIAASNAAVNSGYQSSPPPQAKQPVVAQRPGPPPKAQQPTVAPRPSGSAPQQAAQPGVAQRPGPAAVPGSLSHGQSVFAEFRGGWYLANVVRTSGLKCDVAWRRPNAEQWGCKQVMAQYLCSTGADETCHGTGLNVATSVRLPEGTTGLPKSAQAHDVKTFDLFGDNGSIDLLGDLSPAPPSVARPEPGPGGPAPAPLMSPGNESLDLLS